LWKKNINNAKFCEDCGQPIENEKQKSKPQKGAGRITETIVYSIFVFIIFCIFIYNFLALMYSGLLFIAYIVVVVCVFLLIRYLLNR